MKRRSIIKSLTMIPFAGALVPFKSLFAAPRHDSTLLQNGIDGFVGTGGLPESNIFQSIGVEPIINCRGTFTIIGGSVERPEVRKAMEAASKDFVQYLSLIHISEPTRQAEISYAVFCL